MTFFARFILTVVLLSLTACGQKGPLYLPDQEYPKKNSDQGARDEKSRQTAPKPAEPAPPRELGPLEEPQSL